MTSREHLIVDLINDPTCIALMVRDGVKAHEVLNLMRSVRPMVQTESSYRRLREEVKRQVA